MPGVMAIKIKKDQTHVFSVEIFRLSDGEVIEVGLYGTARAARNYGSFRTGGNYYYASLLCDYRIKKIPIGEGVEIPKLKKLAD